MALSRLNQQYLGLFGLFVSQVTGSFVIGGAEVVTHQAGVVGKVIAVACFLLSAALTAGVVHALRDAGRATLPWALALETLLLAVFTVLLLTGPPVSGPTDAHGIAAGAFGAMAIGCQSVIVKNCMKSVGFNTNGA